MRMTRTTTGSAETRATRVRFLAMRVSRMVAKNFQSFARYAKKDGRERKGGRNRGWKGEKRNLRGRGVRASLVAQNAPVSDGAPISTDGITRSSPPLAFASSSSSLPNVSITRLNFSRSSREYIFRTGNLRRSYSFPPPPLVVGTRVLVLESFADSRRPPNYAATTCTPRTSLIFVAPSTSNNSSRQLLIISFSTASGSVVYIAKKGSAFLTRHLTAADTTRARQFGAVKLPFTR